MPDVFLVAKAIVAGALVAALVMVLATRRSPGGWRSAACWSWAVGAGVIAASAAVGQWPHWPPREDRARFVTLIVPLAMLTDTFIAGRTSRAVRWIALGCCAAAVAPILLYDSVYLKDWNGPGSAEWTTGKAAAILVGLAAACALQWAAVDKLQTRTSAASVCVLLTLVALATGLCVMLSGYFGAGVVGLGVAASLAGAALVALWVHTAVANASLGVAITANFAILLMGRFFGSLSTPLAVCLFLAPLAAWAAEIPSFPRLSPRWRGALRIACVCIPLALAVVVAARQFAVAAAGNSSGFSADETSAVE
jgi:hypothetical protein